MPLSGKRVVITRAAHQAAELADLLLSRGAIPVAYPCITIVPPEDSRPLEAALRQALSGEFDWLVLTSSNAADAVGRFVGTTPESTPITLSLTEDEPAKTPFFVSSSQPDQPSTAQMLSPIWDTVKVAAAGEATAQRTQIWLGRRPDSIPAESSAGGVADALASHIEPGARILMPISEIARPELQERLTGLGAIVTAVMAYRTVIGSGGEDVPTLLRNKQIDAMTFTSPSTVKNFLTRLANEGGQQSDLDGVTIACIGSTTAKAARDLGLSVTVTPTAQTMLSLTDSLQHGFS